MKGGTLIFVETPAIILFSFKKEATIKARNSWNPQNGEIPKKIPTATAEAALDGESRDSRVRCRKNSFTFSFSNLKNFIIFIILHYSKELNLKIFL
jgi:hypothetical protein